MSEQCKHTVIMTLLTGEAIKCATTMWNSGETVSSYKQFAIGLFTNVTQVLKLLKDNQLFIKGKKCMFHRERVSLDN